jgi:tryptophan-rich sensory protein
MIPISQPEAYLPYIWEAFYICNTPPSWYTPWSKKQTNKDDLQLVIFIVALLKACMRREPEMRTTVA